ncbi:hypothetical protein ACKWTF_008731 [Chironomus riparius]
MHYSKMASSMHFILIILLNLGLTLQQENQNYLNYHQPQGRFLSSFPQNSRNGFFPSVPQRSAASQQQQGQKQQSGNYQQHDLYLDGPSTPSFFPFQTFATTRAPNPFEISPRPFVTPSPLPTRGQFSNFGQTSGRQNGGYQFESNPYNFAPSAPPAQQQPQRLSPYLDSTGYDESQIDEYDESQTYIKAPKSRGGSTFQRTSDENRSIERVPSHSTSIKTNKDRFLENLRQRPITTTVEPTSIITTTPRAKISREELAKKSRYTPITSTTSKRPQPKQTESDAEYNDQKYAFTKNNKVKSTLNVRPLGYHVNITHNGEEKNPNPLSVKALNAASDNTREQFDENSGEDDDDVEYIDYEEEDDDYGVILNENDRAKKEKSYIPTTIIPTTKIPITTTTSPIPTTNKPEDHTKIIFDNFILPKNQDISEQNDDDEEVEYEYEYEDETDAPEVKTTDKPTTTKPESEEIVEITTFRDPNRILSEAVVSVVTSKTVVNGTFSRSSEELNVQQFAEETTTEAENYPPTRPSPTKSTTDSNYVVIASVQTSRSVSGAHFLPFPHVEQKEVIQSRSELTNKKALNGVESATDIPEVKTTQISETENVSAEVQDEEDYHSSEVTTTASYSLEEAPTTVPTTVRNIPLPSTESIIDKLDGIQSDLSLGVLSGEFPVLKDNSSKKTKPVSSVQPSSSTEATPSEEEVEVPKEIEAPTTVKPLVLIRKFSPKAQSTTRKPITTTSIKVTIKSTTPHPTTTSTTTEEPITTTQNNSVLESSQRSNKKISFEDAPNEDLAGLLPPGYKLRPSFKNKKFSTTTSQPETTKEELVAGKSRNATISRSFKSQPSPQDLNSKLKSKDKFNLPKSENDTTKKFNKLFESSDAELDISKFLPPDFKDKAKNESVAVIPIVTDELSKFLPPGFKLDPTTTSTETPKIKVIEDDLNKFLPPGYKPPTEEKEKEDVKDDISSILNKIKFTEVAIPLPPGFSENGPSSTTEEPVEESSSTTKSGKLVFPTRAYKKPARVTTPKSNMGEGPKPPEIEIRKGPPTRATTLFTGWPSKPTTPFSLEKFLEIQKNAMQIDISEILARSTTEQFTTPFFTTTTTTTTSTTTTTTPRPREATVCKTDCSLAATIRIIDGIEWSPELLTHHTEEYKNLATELESDLNEVYTKSEMLSKWYKSIRIDAFSKGSVLVDYFIELKDIPNEMNTTEIKKLFHDALEPATVEKKAPSEDENEAYPQPIVKEAYKLGNFVVDPISTDFIVIQKVATINSDEEDEDVLLPQWAIAMITIGLLSLVCSVLFGVAVLINRKKAAKKKGPTPLTADMLNELNKNHMGGFDNYGAEDAYNLEDTWDERRSDVKPKRMQPAKGSNPNIYDSWRSQHIQRYQADEFYYDSHDPYNEFKPKQHQAQQQQQQQNHHPYSSSGTNRFMEPNWNEGWNENPYHPGSSHNFNTSNTRRYRDYDQHF